MLCDWEALSRPISPPHTGRSSQAPHPKPPRELNHVRGAILSTTPLKQTRKNRGRNHPRQRLSSQPQGATKLVQCLHPWNPGRGFFGEERERDRHSKRESERESKKKERKNEKKSERKRHPAEIERRREREREREKKHKKRMTTYMYICISIDR